MLREVRNYMLSPHTPYAIHFEIEEVPEQSDIPHNISIQDIQYVPNDEDEPMQNQKQYTLEECAYAVSILTNFQFKEYISQIAIIRNLLNFIKPIENEKLLPLLVPLLLHILNSNEFEMKMELLENFPSVIEYLGKQAFFYNKIIESFLPMIKMLHGNSNLSSLANNCFLSIANILNEDDIGTHILTYTLTLAHEDNIEYKLIALPLISKLAERLGRVYCESYIVHDITYLSSDDRPQMRKCVCLNLINICNVVGQSVFEEKLVSVYCKLALDNHSCIRRASLIIFMRMFTKCYTMKKSTLINILISLLEDKNTNVQMHARRVLGPALLSSTLNIMQPRIVHEFANMSAMGEEDCLQCAKYMPAVAFNMGEKGWPILSDAFIMLAYSKKISVKQSMASGISEFFDILSTEHHSQLFKIYTIYLKDKGSHFIRLF